MKVTVIIPVYNGEKYIRKAILSVLRQTIDVSEIIVIDDGSIDGTLIEVKKLKKQYENISVYSQANMGVSKARNLGVSKALTEWLLFLDADDMCESTLLEEYTKLINENTEAVYGKIVQVDREEQIISEGNEGEFLEGEIGFLKMMKRNPIISPSGCIVKKICFDEIKGFDETLKFNEDVDFWLKLLLAGGRIEYLDKPLIKIRRHESNATAKIGTTNIGETKLQEKYSYSFLYQLLKKNYKGRALKFQQIEFLLRYDLVEKARELTNGLDNERLNTSEKFLISLLNLKYKDLGAAECLYTQIIQVDSKHGASLNNLGVIYALKGEKELAEKYFKLALEYYPGYYDATNNLSVLVSNGTNDAFKFTLRELRKKLLRYN